MAIKNLLTKIKKFKGGIYSMSKDVIGDLKTCSVVTRHSENPILAPDNVPYNPALTFNAGVTKFNEKYIMLIRNDYIREGANNIDSSLTDIGVAYSDDGINWEVVSKPIYKPQEDSEIINRVYDPRITVLDDKYYIYFAVDTDHGVRGGLAETEDFKDFTMISMSVPDTRNMVLFPKLMVNM